jgi:16S rRNA C1402 N4-methylase RsmH
VIGIDQDPMAIEKGILLEKEFLQRFKVLHGRFGDMKNLIQSTLNEWNKS